MFIQELSRLTGVSPKTIRYYESLHLLPRPTRAQNNYRQYTPADVERLRFIAGARRLGISLADIADILKARDQGIAPCDRVLNTLARRLDEIDRHIADLLALRDSLKQLHTEGKFLPRDDAQGERCICYLLKTYRDSGRVEIQKDLL
jgi:DNA-binding transcriptional MerR regulator